MAGDGIYVMGAYDVWIQSGFDKKKNKMRLKYSGEYLR